MVEKDTQMKIITIKSLAKIDFDFYELYTDDDEEGEAHMQAWAKYMEANVVWKYVRPNGVKWLVKS